MKPAFKKLAAAILIVGLATPLWAQEVIVLAGLEETIECLESENWWGEEKHGEQLTVPRTMIVGISER